MAEVGIGALRAEYRAPEGPGPHPALVVVHEIFGLNADLRRILDLLVGEGYAVLAPDLYSPGLRPLCVARTVVDLVRGAAGTETLARLGEARAWLGRQPEVDDARVGVIGFCLGGGFALVAAAAHDYAAASVNYGLVPKDTAVLEGVCPVVAGYGGDDRPFRDAPQRLETALDRLGVAHDIKVYPGVGHSFMNRSLPGWIAERAPAGYDEDAAADAWRRIFAFFGDHLGPARA